PGLKAGEAGDQRAREEAEASVVIAHGLVELPALHGDPVLGALELALKRQEILVRFEVGVALDGNEKSRQRARKLILRLLELLQRLRILERFRRELDRRGAGPRLRDLFQHRALLRRESLDRFDQVRDQVGPALIDVLHLRPLLVDVLIEPDELVIDGDRPHGDTADEDDQNQGDHEPARHERDDYILARTGLQRRRPIRNACPTITSRPVTRRPLRRTRSTTTRSRGSSASAAPSSPARPSTPT